MSIEQVQRSLKQLDKDIVSLEKKMSDLTAKEANKTKRIADIKRSINKNTSESMLKTKIGQIDRYQKEITKVISDKADINKKIADKRKRKADATVKLQKEEQVQAKALAKEQEKIYTRYEQQITNLTNQIKSRDVLSASDKNIFDSSNVEEYDVFVSHATEDKKSFCDEFVRILKEEYDLKVWYDTLSLKWGDSIRTEIDNGLKKSKFGVVILSRNYIKKYWTNYELEGLFQRESNGGKLILPVWHDITKQEVQNFSLSLAGKMAMNTAFMTPEEIAESLSEILGISK